MLKKTGMAVLSYLVYLSTSFIPLLSSFLYLRIPKFHTIHLNKQALHFSIKIFFVQIYTSRIEMHEMYTFIFFYGSVNFSNQAVVQFSVRTLLAVIYVYVVVF